MNLAPAFLVTVFSSDNNESDLGRRYILSPTGTTIGNTSTADIPLKSAVLSNCLLKFFYEDNRWFLSDLTESNQAYRNHLLIHNGQIYDGDVIHIGSMGFEFCSAHGEKAKYFEKIENLLQEDFLTKAYNRSFLYKLLALEVARYNRWQIAATKNSAAVVPPPICIIFIDVDNFGKINKQYGHAAGDEILIELVKRIKVQLRSTDIVARYGGEEFAIVLLDTPIEQAVLVAENIRLSVQNNPFRLDPQMAFSVTVSGGVAALETNSTVDVLLSKADQKMRLAKAQGKNKILGKNEQ